MENDANYWHEVEIAFEGCLRERLPLSEDKLWEFAKERVELDHLADFALARAKKEGRKYLIVLGEEMERLWAQRIV